MNTTYRASLVGVGRPSRLGEEKDGWKIGYIHTEMLAQSSRIHLTSGVDLSEANLNEWKNKFEIASGYLSLAQMLKEECPDIIGVATYVGSHFAIMEEAARAGVRGILCEKPFLNSPSEWAKLRALIAETGVKIVVNHMRRHQPIFVEIRRRLDEGAIGTLELAVAGIQGWDLSEMGAHWLDLYRFFNHDEPLSWAFAQTCTQELRGFGHCMETHAVGYCGFANGSRGLLDGGQSIGTSMLTLQGSDGFIRVHDETKAEIIARGGVEILEAPAYEPSVWQAPWHALLDWMEGGDEPDLGATNQLLTSELNLGLYLSALSGTRVDFPIPPELAGLDEWPVDMIARKQIPDEPHML